MMTETTEHQTARIVAETAEATAKAVVAAAQATARVLVANDSTSVALLQQDVKSMKDTHANFECEVSKKFDGLAMKFDEIGKKLDMIVQGRPTWAISIIITFLTSVSVALIVYLATK